jgi:hypothetical protein
MFTNRSRGRFLREENKFQRVLVYSCGVDIGTNIWCYALVRVPFDTDLYETTQREYSTENPLTDAEKSEIPILGMDPKILFIVPGQSRVTKNVITDDDDKTLEKSVKSYDIKIRERMKKKAMTIYAENPTILQTKLDSIEKLDDHNTSQFFSYEFTSFISSDSDRYRIIILRLSKFGELFDKIVEADKKARDNHPAAIVTQDVVEHPAAIVTQDVVEHPAAIVDDE